jgi:chromosome partitioning protein
MQQYIVINCKGGCGKTTLSSNLASFFASTGAKTALVDHDPQGSSINWLTQRPSSAPLIQSINPQRRQSIGLTHSFQNWIPADTQHVILDTPAGMEKQRLFQLLPKTTAILIPVMPSAIDRHVVLNFLNDLRSIAKTNAPGARIGIIANRVHKNTRAFLYLQEALAKVDIPLITWLRDSENYTDAAETGLGIFEQTVESTYHDRLQWLPLLPWLGGEPPLNI